MFCFADVEDMIIFVFEEVAARACGQVFGEYHAGVPGVMSCLSISPV